MGTIKEFPFYVKKSKQKGAADSQITFLHDCIVSKQVGTVVHVVNRTCL